MTRPVECVWPVRTATPLSPIRWKSSSPASSPEFHRAAVAPLEILGEPQLVFLRERGVEHELALLLRAGDQSLGAIGAAIAGDRHDRWRWLDRQRAGGGDACENRQGAQDHRPIIAH